MTEIINNLWLGDHDSARYTEKYDVIINCTTDLPFYDNLSSHFLEKIRISVWDKNYKEEIEKLKQCIFIVLETINVRLSEGKRILIHCGAGQSRSPSVIACYLLYKNKVQTIDDVIKFIKSKNSNAFFGGISFLPLIEFVSNHNL